MDVTTRDFGPARHDAEQPGGRGDPEPPARHQRRTEPSHPRESHLTGLRDAGQEYRDTFREAEREVARLMGLNETDLRCLEFLRGADEEVSPGLLAVRLGRTPGSVSALLDRLERGGLIVRRVRRDDRRRVVVRPTGEASERAGELTAPHLDDLDAQLSRRYSPEQLAVIADFLVFSTDVRRQQLKELRDLPAPPGGREEVSDVRAPRRG
ncbi:MarR family transcriptional regulator [Streptomyces sp. LHD-70]|uniref:MarR family transcriptional regulator n=1 Tax=Streptomyces sp. LHD-70 TaxID=3072140 RepID=UPI00281079F4|nr:MarR family transcriptional regulator [Streptomyces sp. LHD-70]MDQ8706923.1 MarR family transcriptional regulator [Streptomyces sp. LHD-70]